MTVNPAPCPPPDLEDLYRTHRGRVLRLCRLLLADATEAADVAQDVFLRVDQARQRPFPPQDWGAWIARVTVNACSDRRRSAWWRWWRRGGVALDDNTPSAVPTPEQDAARREQHARIWAALRRLPDRQREVFVLRHLEGFATHEVAIALGIAPGSVKRHLFRAVHTLRRALGDRT